MKTLFKTIHGSRLYGLENDNSDHDYKSCFPPTLHDCLLLKAPKSISDKEMVDGVKSEFEGFALQRFLDLAANGEDVTISMLHAPDSKVLSTSDIFEKIRQNRKLFYTKNMNGALGYARSMAAKYALRADRMDTVLKVIAIIEKMREKGVARLFQAWGDLPEMPHATHKTSERDRSDDKRIYEVAGKALPVNITPDYALDILYRVRDAYGHRVKSAHETQGEDMKAISHSFRVGYQLFHIYKNGGFSYPLDENDFVRAVKEGKLNFVNDKLDEKLNDLITEIEELSKNSHYPDSVDRGWMDELILEAYDYDMEGFVLANQIKEVNEFVEKERRK